MTHIMTHTAIVRRFILGAVLVATAVLVWRRARAPQSKLTDEERELARRGWLDTTHRR
jgi:hypothetical protein